MSWSRSSREESTPGGESRQAHSEHETNTEQKCSLYGARRHATQHQLLWNDC